MEVNIHEAKTHFSRLIQRVEAGEEIVIARAGKAVAKLVAVLSPGQTRPVGMDRGKIWMADDFDVPDAEVEAIFGDAPLVTQDARYRKKRKKS
jgi:prevent-host-death family protein